MVSAITADGYLLKKKRDDKRSFLSSKYQRRYFELTSDTLAYAKDPRELKDGGGNIEVFAIHELKYIKKLEDGKLEMKFPERVLRVKAESKKDHERWYEAIKDARQKKLDGNNTPQAKQLETLKETTKQQILTALEEDSDADDVAGAGTVHAPMAVRKVDTLLTKPAAPQPQTAAAPNRPPSPRSLLANPRMANIMIAAPSRKDDMEQEPEEPVQRHPKARSRWQDEEDEEAAAAEQAATASRPGTSGSTASNASSGNQPAQRPPSGRLMLGANDHATATAPRAGGPTGVQSGAAPAPRGEKLHLGDSRLPPPGPSAGAHHAAQQVRSSQDAGQKLSLGGPPVAAGPASGASRGSRPGSGEPARGASRSGNVATSGSVAAGGTVAAEPAPTEGKREEWEEDDWDSSDGEEPVQEAARKPAAAAPPPQRQQPGRAPAGRVAAANGSGAPSARTSAEGGVLQRPSADRASAAQRNSPPQKSNERLSSARGKAPAAPAVAASQPDPDEEEEPDTVLAKHAAGTDHLDDNWDSDADDEEAPANPAPPARARPQPAAPAPAPAAPQRRIPGPPPAAPAPVAPPSPARPPAGPRLAAPASPAAGTRGRGGRPSHEGSTVAAPAPVARSSGPGAPPAARGSGHGAPPATGTERQKLELGGGEPGVPGFRSNVVHDPAAKPDDKNWVEEDWDDDD